MRNFFVFLFTIIGCQNIAVGQDENIIVSREDSLDAIEPQWIYPDDHYVLRLDEQFKLLFSEADSGVNSFNISTSDSIPVWTKEDIKTRLGRLNETTPLDLRFNDATYKMISFYLRRRREMLSRVSGLTKLYYPLFEAELDRKGLPQELKHLAVVESALVNVIRSRAGAVGLWQFMYNTGKYLGMNIDSYVDERCDPVVSTRTAIKYLEYLYNLYDDWYMALAAYNAGPGNVNKAIRRSGGKRTYWEISQHLPRETRSYVPAFIAVNYIMSHLNDHHIVAKEAKYSFLDIDSVHVTKSVRFDQISEVLCISIDTLKFLNPQYTKGVIPLPKSFDKCYTLSLPTKYLGVFLKNEALIYEYVTDSVFNLLKGAPSQKKTETTHVVKKGQSLGSIANKYDVSVSEILSWNSLRSNVIRPRQKLKIFITTEEEDKTETKTKAKKKTRNYKYYTIRRGDSLSEIADKYKGVTVKSLMRLNKMKRRDKLFPGKTIKLRLLK